MMYSLVAVCCASVRFRVLMMLDLPELEWLGLGFARATSWRLRSWGIVGHDDALGRRDGAGIACFGRISVGRVALRVGCST